MRSPGRHLVRGSVRLSGGVKVKPSTLLRHRWDRRTGSKARIVEVLWHDATGVWAEEWGDVTDIEKAQPAKTVTVGYLMKDADDHLVLASMCNDSHVGLGLVIPKGMVVQIRLLDGGER